MAAAISTIEDWVYSTLIADSTLLTAIGGNSTTPRVYYYYPPVEAWGCLTEASGALISYYLGSSGGISGNVVWAVQKPDETVMIDIYSYVKSVINLAFNRIDVLLNENLSSSITGWKIWRIHRVNKVDMYDPDAHFYNRHIEYRFSGMLDAS
jgi:hypothetical protein